MKERGRCGRRNCEKVETEEERLGVPQTGTQVGPDAENNGALKDLRKGGGGSLVVRSDLSLQLLAVPLAPSGSV